MALRAVSQIQPKLSKLLDRPERRTAPRARVRDLELLESRQLLAIFSVTNLNNSGAGSLRQAIIASNQSPGADTIDFQVAGTIRVSRTSLPAISDTVTIDGSSAPSFAGSPVVSIDFHGTSGLAFNLGSNGSSLKSLSLVGARNAGVTLNASNVTVAGNDIGLLAAGTTVDGNRGDGIQINATSHGDLIGHSNPVSSINYYNADSVKMQPVSGWQGIRSSGTSGQYLITGTSASNGLLYVGPITGAGGTSYAVNYPSAIATSVYGPDVLPNNGIRLVGTYRTGDGTVHGFLFEGTTADLSHSGNYRTIDYPNV
jgi:hypothetical protein